MSAVNEIADIGRMLSWAARPREVPTQHADYHRLVARYRNDPDFGAAVDAVFAGAGLTVIVDERDGVIVTAESESALRVTLTDIMKRAQPHHRAVIGLALLGVARCAYPDAATLEDPDRVAVFTTQAVVDVLDRACQRRADTSDDDGSASDDDVEVWRRWLAVAPARANAARRSASDRAGVVHRVCRFLADAGYVTARGETDGGTWLARPRLRHSVTALCEDSDLYASVNRLLDEPPVGDVSLGRGQ